MRLQSLSDRLRRAEALAHRQQHMSVLHFAAGVDPLALHDAAAAAGRVDTKHGVLIVPSPAATDELFDLALARGDFHGGRAQASVTSETRRTASTPETAGNTEPAMPLAPEADDWQQALAELQRRLAVQERHGRRE